MDRNTLPFSLSYKSNSAYESIQQHMAQPGLSDILTVLLSVLINDRNIST